MVKYNLGLINIFWLFVYEGFVYMKVSYMKVSYSKVSCDLASADILTSSHDFTATGLFFLFVSRIHYMGERFTAIAKDSE